MPPDLHDELEVMRATGEAYAREIVALGLEGLLDPALQPQRDHAQAILESPAMHEAADTLEAFLLSCPSL